MRKWTIEVIEENDELIINRSNDGFNLCELIGFSELIREELIGLAKGKKPNKTTKTIIITKP